MPDSEHFFFKLLKFINNFISFVLCVISLLYRYLNCSLVIQVSCVVHTARMSSETEIDWLSSLISLPLENRDVNINSKTLLAFIFFYVIGLNYF